MKSDSIAGFDGGGAEENGNDGVDKSMNGSRDSPGSRRRKVSSLGMKTTCAPVSLVSKEDTSGRGNHPSVVIDFGRGM